MRTINQRFLVVVKVVLFIGYTLLVSRISLYMEKPTFTSKTAREKYLRNTIRQDPVAFEETISKLANEGRLFQKAVNHVRGTKAKDAMIVAGHALDEVLRVFDLDSLSVTRRHAHEAQSVCPEIFKGGRFGYPFYYEGFELVKCDHHIPEERLLTIVTLWDERRTNLSRFLMDVQKYNRKLAVIVGLFAVGDFTKGNYTSISSYVSFQYFKTGTSKGHIWNKLITSVNTPYVLVARDTIMFNDDSRIHRLISEIERLELISAGGASRDSDGHWKIGCLQRAYKHNTIVLEEGYQESAHECIFCDHIDSSFVIRTKTCMEIKFDENIIGEGIWEDFFMRTGGESVICPDSMFYVNPISRSSKISDWKQFGRKYKLKKMKFISLNLEFDFGCPKVYSCSHDKGYAVEACCLQELTNLVTFVMSTCAEMGIFCELAEGTVLGAVKFQNVLPWERDADIGILRANYTKFRSLSKKVSIAGYTLVDQTKMGLFRIDSKNWFIEIYGQSTVDTEILIDQKLAPTKLLFHGQWVNAPRNPGLYARNRYGHEIYRHAEHWRTTGNTDGFIDYKTEGFAPCNKPGSHNCLDRYNSDGNLQFSDPIP
ncbi:hypothetical protein KP79_PYT00767 [Mizuhopecten yessoensis]|uniref:LicD/FKTN/FKRP nucleotidyltransferase domain-containing protein n=1 Tax=Mizuhopecten yessoensis TaxID=6573 RepID=A0A210QQS6_MIZYE|nr:hypothetical protein KP79_PYT00767 [Mizuhopecten yessoensis]